jgi:hypothetical protein
MCAKHKIEGRIMMTPERPLNAKTPVAGVLLHSALQWARLDSNQRPTDYEFVHEHAGGGPPEIAVLPSTSASRRQDERGEASITLP